MLPVKYLCDECVAIQAMRNVASWVDSADDAPCFEHVVQVLGCATDDPRVLEYCVEHNCVLITKDKNRKPGPKMLKLAPAAGVIHVVFRPTVEKLKVPTMSVVLTELYHSSHAIGLAEPGSRFNLEIENRQNLVLRRHPRRTV